MENLIEIYNPRNASKLTDEQIQAMQTLTDEQIKALAEAYPNQPTGNAYLKYFIKSDGEKQRFPLGTWKNLHSLRKLGKKDIVAFGFTKSKLPAEVKGKKVAPKKTVDLSANEVIEGMKAGVSIMLDDVPADPKYYAGQVDPLLGNVNEDAKEDFASTVEVSEAVKAYNEIQEQLINARETKAHPQTIKSLERKLSAAQETIDAEEK